MRDEVEKEMLASTKPIESTDITYITKEEYEIITEMICSPVKLSDFVKRTIKNYQQARNEE